MKDIVKITRISAKESFKKLRENWPYFCDELNKNIKISNLFLNHITWYWRKRTLKETILRLLIIPLIDIILKNWNIDEVRWEVKIEWKKYLSTHRVKLKISEKVFTLIVWERLNEKEIKEFVLISSFIDHKNFINTKKKIISGLNPS